MEDIFSMKKADLGKSRRKPDWVQPPAGEERIHMKLDASAFFALAFLMGGRGGGNSEKSGWIRDGLLKLAREKGFDADEAVRVWQETEYLPDFVKNFKRQRKHRHV